MGRTTYTEKLAAIVLGLLAVLSPLYIDRRPPVEHQEEIGYGSLGMWLPFVLIVLIVVINFTCFLDRRFTRFDPYWIHRVGGSSFGIMTILLVIGFVLKFKASFKS